ncbi:fructosamine kinase family protein [Granulosicoccus sp.]|nr:fructosamine kinase family protein [Granulosicoccus sp.]MDB4222302.1 fructosamine kinase family protein [Granulosicoccus sp.]
MTKSLWQAAAEKLLNVQFTNLRQVGGGDFAQSWCAEIASCNEGADVELGALVFVKTHGNPPPNHFSTEARGLRWLKETGSVAIPTVLGASDDPPYLALEWIEEGGRNAQSESDLGASLALLHQFPCACFGREDKRTTGSLGLPNEPCDSWAEFYSTQRLLPLARIASDRQALSESMIQRIESLAQRLGEFTELDVPPSRLHGDLWAGNRLVDRDGINWLIDPACHGGHREFDLAMMQLFGGYGQRCFDVYQDRFPLSAGWQSRIQLHQLAPLIVHAIKFGRSYVAPTDEALSKYE